MSGGGETSQEIPGSTRGQYRWLPALTDNPGYNKKINLNCELVDGQSVFIMQHHYIEIQSKTLE